MKLPSSAAFLVALLGTHATNVMAAEFKVLVVMSYETNNP